MSSSIEFDASVWGRFAINRDAFDLQIRRARSPSGTARLPEQMLRGLKSLLKSICSTNYSDAWVVRIAFVPRRGFGIMQLIATFSMVRKISASGSMMTSAGLQLHRKARKAAAQSPTAPAPQGR